MLRRIVICLMIVIAGMIVAGSDARPRHIDATPFAHAPCSVLSGRPCTPYTCSVFNRGPCIPEIDYPYGENLQLTVRTVPPQDDKAQYQKPDQTMISTPSATSLRRCAPAGRHRRPIQPARTCR